MDRPRHRRRDPRRTGPIRNAGEPWREGGFPRDPGRQGEDAASDGVREGYRVIEEQIRRGRRMAEKLDDEPWYGDRHDRERRQRSRYSPENQTGYEEESPWSCSGGGGLGLLGMPLRHLDRLVREILRQISSARPDPWKLIELLLRLQIEAVAELARLGFGTLGMMSPRGGDSFDKDYRRVERDIDESLDEIDDMDDDPDEGEIEDELWDWPAAPSVPTVIRSTVPIPVHISTHERSEVDLELPAGAQSLDLVIEPPLATGPEPALPAFEAEFIALSDGPVILRIEVARDLPAGVYRRRVLVRATGEPVGDLTVQIGTIPAAKAPRVRSAANKKEKKR